MTARWEPLETAEAAMQAMSAGRYVEFTACGCDYDVPGRMAEGSEGWVALDMADITALADGPVGKRDRYRALIEDSK